MSVHPKTDYCLTLGSSAVWFARFAEEKLKVKA